ncbi:MAG: extracellular solute-binding protein [Tissierellia bacterium]|nr:extracellular solute-binding protein [Tissierellia bacterium]
MKRKTSILLALLLAFVMVLSACGPKEGDVKEPGKEAGEGEKTALTGQITVQTESGWLDFYKMVAEKLVKENPDAKIEFVETGSFDHLDVIKTTSAENKDVADLFSVPADRLEDLTRNDVLAAIPAKEMADKIGGFENFDEGLGGIFKVEDNYFAFPYNIETLVTFVNKKNAEDLGIDSSKPFEMTEQKDEATVLLPIFDAWFGVAPNNAVGIDLLARKDGKFSSTYTKAYADLEADQKAVFDGLYEYWKMHDQAVTPLFDPEAGWGYLDEEFTTGGKGVIRLGGPWELGGFIEKAGQENLEVYPIGHITVAGKPLAHWQGGWGLAVNSRIEEDQEKMALAQAYIEALMNPENAVELFKATGKIMPNVGVDVYEKSDLSDLEKKTIKNVFESFEVSVPRPTYPEYGSVWDTWKNSVLSWASKKPASPEDAYKELNAAFTSMMEQLAQ